MRITVFFSAAVAYIGALDRAECFSVKRSGVVDTLSAGNRNKQLLALAASPGGGRHSYVEGSDSEFVDSQEEVEAMGGDPFFLMDDEDDGEEEETFKFQSEDGTSSMANIAGLSPALAAAIGTEDKKEEKPKYYATDGTGPAPKSFIEASEKEGDDWEWDGTVDENAHMDL